MGRRQSPAKGSFKVERGPIPNQFRWPRRLARLLGKVPDAKLAAKAGIGPSTVGAERSRRGIPPCKPKVPWFDWTPDRVALLGAESDKHVAAHLGLSPAAVGRKRRILGIPPVSRQGPGAARVDPTRNLAAGKETGSRGS
jgi:hypothetical protein